MLMRVSVGIHGEDIEGAIETYNMLSEKLFTHASPTMFNAATPRPQLSSCFLLTMANDSIEGIYDTLKRCALISKSAGGIGLNVHCIRATGSYIAGTNGTSNGLVPMLRVYNNTARYVDQVNNDKLYVLHIARWLTYLKFVFFREVISVREPLQSTSSHGMPTSTIFSICEKITAKKNSGLVTFSLHCGSRIFLWNESKSLVTGVWCAPMNLQVKIFS